MLKVNCLRINVKEKIQMKKILAICLALMLLFAFVACDENQQTDASVSTPTATVQGDEATPTATGEADPATTPATTENAQPTATPGATATATATTQNHTHSWGNWTLVTKAYVDKKGSEKRVCSTCQATETRERTVNAVYNSFYDGGYQYVLSSHNNLTAFNIMGYACHEFHQYMYKPTKRTVILNELTKYFDMDDTMKNNVLEDMKWYEYNEATDEIILSYSAESCNFFLEGYKHLGGNKYATYYSAEEFYIEDDTQVIRYYKIEIEYNRSNGGKNKFVSVYLIDAVPNDVIKPATDEWIDNQL